jgi:hypothetical protein
VRKASCPLGDTSAPTEAKNARFETVWTLEATIVVVWRCAI